MTTTLTGRVNAELAEAMRARDPVRLSALRLLKTALTNKDVERGRPLSEAEAVQVVQGLAKQRRESIEQFTAANRMDLVAKEEAELRVLEGYLPPPMDAAQLAEIVDAAIQETGAVSAKDLGRVMKAVMARLAGQPVDGKRVNELVRSRLT
jgi:uncharacterized protein YqeY